MMKTYPLLLLLLLVPFLSFAQKRSEFQELKAVIADARHNFKNVQSTRQLQPDIFYARNNILGTEVNLVQVFTDSTGSYDAFVWRSGRLSQESVEELFTKWHRIIKQAAEDFEDLDGEAVYLTKDVYGARFRKKEGRLLTTIHLTYSNANDEDTYSLALSVACSYVR
jgi:hypothetical protein